jgi:predicted AlkP superfamily phosphohydrolase/phosphomutase
MRFLKFLLWCVCALPLPARVLLISLDGMGYEFLRTDPIAGELTALHTFAKQGAHAAGILSHFPSTTANAHAALWTGTWGDVNGITANSMPQLPRSEHRVTDWSVGYRSDGLQAEPLWVTAARYGVKAVAQQVTQAYPFSEQSVGGSGLKVPPVVLNGYQTRLIADHAALRRADMKAEPCGDRLPASRRKPLCFSWTAGPVVLHGALLAPSTDAYTVFSVRAEGTPSGVEARLAPLETEPPRKRSLGRNFSSGLFLKSVADAGPAVVYFRLFEAEADGSDFLLYQTPIHELGVHPEHLREPLLREAGGFIGNGPLRLLRTNKLSERAYLEAVELILSLSVRHARWLIRHEQPELYIGYLTYPDEIEHQWKGPAALEPRYNDFRRWGYVALNRALKELIALRRRGDDLIFASDHGMTAVHREVHVNGALLQAGLLAVDRKGKVDSAHTQVLDMRNCLLVNTTDWKSGVVAPEQVDTVKAKAIEALRGIRDPATGQAVITDIYSSREDAERFGFGGSGGPQICYDLLPGYLGADSTAVPLVQEMKIPVGAHGFAPTRADMKAILIAAGPGFPRGRVWPTLRLIDIAPLVSRLLGIDAPAQSRDNARDLFADTKR